MAKFCTKCGKELENGVCVDCSKKQETKKVNETVDVRGSIYDCFDIIRGIVLKPIETVATFVKDNKYITGIIMIVLAAISSGIYNIALDKSISSAFIKPNYFKDFLNTSLLNLGEFALVAAVGYLLLSKLFGSKTTLKEVVSAVGVSFGVVICAYLVNSVLVFIDGSFASSLRSYIFQFASIYKYLVLYLGIKQISKLDENKLVLNAASMFVLASVLMEVIQKIFK